MKKIDVEELMKEAKIMYWQEDNDMIYQQNHIGIPDILENEMNVDKPSIIKL